MNRTQFRAGTPTATAVFVNGLATTVKKPVPIAALL